MCNQVEIRLSGSGGQGLILGGIILAEAALMDDKEAVQSQSYGPEARGGASKAEVIISDCAIHYPKVQKCDVLLSLTQKSCDKYLSNLKENGTLIIDESVELPEYDNNYKIHQMPILKTATKDIGRSMVANIVALGALNEIVKVVSDDSLEKAILNRVPRGTENLNRSAFESGKKITLKKE